jgi:hypothetical protein
MNYLVFLDTQAGELEKILSGVKSMLVKEFDPTCGDNQLMKPGDSLYFLRNNDDCSLRVKATVVQTQFLENHIEEDLSHVLKEKQPRLQLNEGQYSYWSAKEKVLLVEFNCAQKITIVHVSPHMVMDRSDWIAIEDLSLITLEPGNQVP